MSTIKRGTWLFILVLGVFTATTCRFFTKLTYLHVASHIAILTAAHFALIFPPEELLDGLGLTLFDLFSIIYNSRNYNFIEYAAKRVAFFHSFVAFYPCVISAYFVHGHCCFVPAKAVDSSRFPDFMNYPRLWLALFLCSVVGNVIYCFRINDYKKWPVYKYYIDNPECLNEAQEVISNPETFRIKLSQRSILMVTRNFFVFTSNWRFVAVKQSDVTLQVDHTRMPMLPNNQDEEERIRYIFVRATFRPAYLPPLTVTLRQDYYRQLNEILEVPIFIPRHINVPLTIMEEMKEDFIERITGNSRVTYRVKSSEKDPCFACGTEEKIVKIEKACDIGQILFQGAGIRCENCSCRPLWCSSCIAQIFIGRQNRDMMNRSQYYLGSAQCPTCRKNFCIRDVHFVDFEYVPEED